MPIPLTRQSDTSVPDWLVAPSIPAEDVKQTVGVKDFDPVAARQKMEQCAREGKSFHMSASLSRQQQADLKEYAQVVGLQADKVVAVSSDDVRKARLAPSPKNEAAPQKTPDRDPFGLIDRWASEDSFKPNRDWETNKPADKLKTNGTSEGSVQRMDGVEKFKSQRDVKTRPAENSIEDPDAIAKMAQEKTPGSRDVIRQSNKERKDSITFKPAEWEAGVIDSMKDSGIVAKNGIRMTEAAESQQRTTLPPGQHSMFDVSDPVEKMADKTEGEKIAEANEQHRASIQREKPEDRSWDQVKPPTKTEISDLFFEQLKEQMGGESSN